MQTGYKLTTSPEVVIRLDDGASIPRGHRWWGDYEAWIAAGNVPDQVDVPQQIDLVMSEIAQLEAQVTQRRICEAVLGLDGGWLEEQSAKIAALRHQLI